MAQTITIDGRGITIQEAIKEMRARMEPLEQRGFHPISEVDIVDAAKNVIVQTFQLTDPEFLVHLESDRQEKSQQSGRLHEHPHVPEKKEHYLYIARIRLEE